MANTFKNSITGSIGTTGVPVYTAPAATTSTIIGVSVANVISTNITVTVQATDTSSGKSAYLVKNALIPAGSSVTLVGGEQKVVLEASDFLAVTSSAATSADVIIAILEMT